jgi:hypothetical protein
MRPGRPHDFSATPINHEGEVPVTTSSQTPPAQRVAELAPITEALSALIAEFAELPRPYVILHTTSTGIGLQLRSPADFEAWRGALGAPAAGVELHVFNASMWLETSGEFRGVRYVLSGFGVPLSDEQLEAPRGTEAVAA